MTKVNALLSTPGLLLKTIPHIIWNNVGYVGITYNCDAFA